MMQKTETVLFVEEMLSFLDILGPAGKKGLLQELRVKHGIEVTQVSSADLIDRIKAGIIEVFGNDAGALIINRIYMRLAIQHPKPTD